MLQTIINKYELNPEYVNQHYTLDETKKALNLALKDKYLKLD